MSFKSMQPTKPFVTPRAGHGPRQTPLQLKPSLDWLQMETFYG